jgi:hypothetical protein
VTEAAPGHEDFAPATPMYSFLIRVVAVRLSA